MSGGPWAKPSISFWQFIFLCLGQSHDYKLRLNYQKETQNNNRDTKVDSKRKISTAKRHKTTTRWEEVTEMTQNYHRYSKVSKRHKKQNKKTITETRNIYKEMQKTKDTTTRYDDDDYHTRQLKRYTKLSLRDTRNCKKKTKNQKNQNNNNYKRTQHINKHWVFQSGCVSLSRWGWGCYMSVPRDPVV